MVAVSLKKAHSPELVAPWPGLQAAPAAAPLDLAQQLELGLVRERHGPPLKPGLPAQQELRQTQALLPGAAGAGLSLKQHRPKQAAQARLGQLLCLLEGAPLVG